MKVFNLSIKSLIVLGLLSIWSCSKSDPEKAKPILELTTESIQFDANSTDVSKEIEIKSNREWTADFIESDASTWFALDKKSGKDNGTIKVSVIAKDGKEHTATLKISSTILSKSIKITLLGDGAPTLTDAIYMEKCGTAVEKVDNKWPYTDQYTGWSKTGILDQSAVTYSGKSSNVSNSGKTFDPSEGSNLSGPPYVGMNSAAAVFIINNINVSGKTNFTFKMAGIFQSNYSGGPTFGDIADTDFNLYAGVDGTKYAKVSYKASKIGESNWHSIVSEFKVPDGSNKLFIKIETPNIGANQGYRFDDFSLYEGGNGSLINPDGGVTPPPTGDKTYITVAQLRAKGETTINEDVYVKVNVISNTIGGNSTSLKNVVVSDKEAGIMIRFKDNPKDNEYPFGTELDLNLKGAQLSKYNGLLQLNNFVNANAEKTGTVNSVEPVAISAAQLLSGKYESMYVSIADVQVISSDLSKNIGDASKHLSIGVEAKTGEKFFIFTSKYAKFISSKVPQGSGSLKGIASVNNDDYQVMPNLESDFSGMNGTRFSSAPAELSFSTPTFSATKIKKGESIDGGKIKIPYSDAKGTETYNISVAVSGDAAEGINAVSGISKSLSAGAGVIEIDITGTPAKSGSVTFTISGIEGLKTTTVTANVISDASLNLNSNITLPTEKNTADYYYADTVIVNGNKFPCLKLGTSSKTGKYTTKLPKTGDYALTLYSFSWKNKKAKLKITIANGGSIDGKESVEIQSPANDGATGNTPYTMTVAASDLTKYNLTGITAESTITFETVKDTDCRIILFGINAE